MTKRREAALREEAARAASDRTPRAPMGVEPARLREVAGRSPSTSSRPEGATSNEPVARETAPAASSPDFGRRPLRAAGLERFQHYLTLKSPKAFFVFENSAWRFWYDTSDAVANGFAYCQRERRKCWLYAVDETVVWQAEAGRRIEPAEQWEALSRSSAESGRDRGERGGAAGQR